MMRDISPRALLAVFGVLIVGVVAFFVFRLGNQASAGVLLDDPVVWVEHGLGGQILQINGATGEITARVEVGESGDSLVAIPRGRDAVFLNKSTGELGVIGAVSLEVDSIEVLEPTSGLLTGDQLELVGDLSVSPDAYVIDEDLVLVVEPGAGVRLPIPTSSGLADTALDKDGRLLAITPDGTQVGVSSERGLVPLADLPAPINDAPLPQLARSGSSVFVVDVARRTVNEVLEDGQLGTTTCVAGSPENARVARSYVTSSTADAAVLVHDPERGVLSVSEPGPSDCFEIVVETPSDNFGDGVAVDRYAYLPNWGDGTVEVIDLVERIHVDSLRFSNTKDIEFELEVFDNAVWANDPQGFLAAIIRGAELTPISKFGRAIIGSAEEAGGPGTAFVERNDEDDVDGSGLGDDGPQTVEDAGAEQRVEGINSDTSVSADDSNAEGEEFVDDAALRVPAELAIPLIAAEADETPDQLVANFNFSAATVNVGESVRFTDTSLGDPISWNWSFDDGTGAEGPIANKAWDTEGVWVVELFVRDASGRESSQSKEITVVSEDVTPPPTANFDFRSRTIEVGEVMVFTDTSTGDPDVFVWDFGDGTTGIGSSVEHAFDQPGTYDVQLTVSNDAGIDETTAQITVISVTLPPEAIIGQLGSRVIETGQSIQFVSESTNSPTAVSWDFDDGSTAQGSQAIHSWNSPGTYQVRLTVSNSAGSDFTIADIIVETPINPPVARFGQSNLTALVGEQLAFNDLSLNNPDTITWEFGDNTTAAGSNVNHMWSTAGTYIVTLRVENAAGFDETTKTVTILPLPPDPPVASFSIPAATVPVNSVLVFSDTSTSGPAQWSWDFGDGTTSSVQNPPHAFSAPGNYNVELTVTNAGGSDTFSQTVRVIDPPIASFGTSINELAVTFSDQTSNGPTSWAWDFGDGTSSTAQSPSKTYALPGTYTVTLVASNAAGSSAPFVSTVTVAEAPDAFFTSTTASLTATFSDTSIKNPTSWLWDFGDGTTSGSQNPSHNYTSPGTYPVTLTVTNAAGSDSTTQTVTVMLAPPVAVFTCTSVGGGVACDGTPSTGATSYSWTAPAASFSANTATATPSFTFLTSGTYPITLVVTNASGVTDTMTLNHTVTVPQPPTISNINVVSNVNGVVALSASASESPTSWTWTTPGAAVAGGATSSPTLTYTTSGSKTVTAIATNAVGSSAPFTINVSVTISMPPVVSNVSESSNSGGTVALVGTATNSPTSWAWSIPGGTVSSGGGSATPTFSFATNGTYPGTVTATNADGTSASYSFTVTVNDLVPVVTSAAPTSNAGGSVVMAGVATNAPTSWSWTITGGTVSAGGSTSTPTLTFTANGTYSGTAIATNASGSSAAFPFTVTITSFLPVPTANFTWVELAPPGEIQFTDASTVQPGATYAWSFGDGTSSTAQNPLVTYAMPGAYTVTLTVTDGGGTNTATQTITVVD